MTAPLTADQLAVSILLAAMLALFAWGRLPYELVAMLTLLAAVFLGLVPGEEAFDGFGHPAVVTVAAVFGLSRALQLSGVADAMARRLTRLPAQPTVQTAAGTGLVGVLSAFMNNVGALALMLPVALKTCAGTGLAPSRLLMPLAFASLLGGLATLIGTPPNVIVATAREAATGAPFAVFDYAWVGLPVAAVGLVLIVVLAGPLLPERQEPASPETLVRIDDYAIELTVPRESRFAHRPLAELEEMTGGDLAVVALVRHGHRRLAPSGRETLEPDDVLLVQTDPATLKRVVDNAGLALSERTAPSLADLRSERVALIEAVVKPGSPLEGTTARRQQLHARFGLNLLGVSRHGKRLRQRLGGVRFRAGDALLLQGDAQAMPQALEAIGCLPLASRALQSEARENALAPIAFVAGLAAAAAGLVSVPVAFSAVLAVVIGARCMTVRELYESIDWPVIVLLGALIPLGGALETSGTATRIAGLLVGVGDAVPTMALLAFLVAVAMALSNVVNNAATAVLMTPIAIDLAQAMAASVDPFLMAVAVGSSCAFLTPIGHQSNLLVMGPGGYRFGDYWRLGLPLSIAVALVAAAAIPAAWPL